MRPRLRRRQKSAPQRCCQQKSATAPQRCCQGTRGPTISVARGATSDGIHVPATTAGVAGLKDAVCIAISQVECASAVLRGSQDDVVVAKATENRAHDKRASTRRQLADVVGAGVMDVNVSAPVRQIRHEAPSKQHSLTHPSTVTLSMRMKLALVPTPSVEALPA